MNTKDTGKRFAKTPDLTAILNSESAKDFIKAGEALTKEPEKEVVKEVVKEVKKTPDKAVVKVSKKKNPVAAPVTEDMNWMSTSPSLRVQHIVRVPAPLKLLIDYLGDTGKGMNQTSISVEGLTKIAETLAKERGLPLPDSWGSWLTK
jgi:hypothetical protein